MFEIIGIMIGGVVAGYLLRRKNLKFVQRLILVTIWLLLFLLGIAVGANENIMENLSTIGLQAFILALGAVGGSVILAWVVYKFFFVGKNA